MAFVPLIVMAVGTAMAAYGSIQQGKTQAANAKSQAAAERYNAVVNTQNASQASAEASAREMMVRSNNEQRLGNIRAGMAENGGFGGTNAGVLRQDTVNAELDALSTRYTGVMQNRAYTQQATLDTFQSKVAGANAGAYRSAGYFGAATALVQGASRMYGSNQAGYG